MKVDLLLVGESELCPVLYEAARHVESVTVVPAMGLWNSQSEPSNVVMLLNEDSVTVARLAKALRERFNQGEVWQLSFDAELTVYKREETC